MELFKKRWNERLDWVVAPPVQLARKPTAAKKMFNVQ
jgi:hypothetical protein